MKDLHVHTSFCDGRESPEEMVLAAIEKGVSTLGLVTHSYTFFDESYCIRKDRVCDFQAELHRLKEKYRDKLELLCGVEQDFYSESSVSGFDYVIGSVHYLKMDGKYLAVDESPEMLEDIVRTCFSGDWYALAREYYATVSQIPQKMPADLIGHFDLITKFNEGNRFFDAHDPRYLLSCTNAIDALLPYHIPFEINTGALFRGYRTEPYPDAVLRKYIVSHGGTLQYSSDAHTQEAICYRFPKDV